MANIIFVVDAHSWEYVISREHISVDELELQEALDMLDPSLNPLRVNAVELRDYLDGRGQLAMRVSLAGQQEVIHNLLKHVSHFLSVSEASVEVVEVLSRKKDRSAGMDYRSAFVRSTGA